MKTKRMLAKAALLFLICLLCFNSIGVASMGLLAHNAPSNNNIIVASELDLYNIITEGYTNIEPHFIWKAPFLIYAAKKMLGTTAVATGVVNGVHLYRQGNYGVRFVSTGVGTYQGTLLRINAANTGVTVTNTQWNWHIDPSFPIPHV